MHQFCSSLTSNVSSDDCLKIDGTDLADHPLHSALHQPAHRISLIARNILVVWRAIFTVRHSKKWVAQTGYIYYRLKMKILCGTLVHCRCPEKIDILVDHVIGFDEHQQGKVAIIILVQSVCSYSCLPPLQSAYITY